MTTLSANYASAASVTITVTSLADGSYRESTVVDNATNKYVDAHVGGKIQVGAVAADGYIYIYAYGTYDGTNFTAGVSGSDGTITWGTTGDTGVNSYEDLLAKTLGVIKVDTTDDNSDIVWGPFSVAEVFGGILPLEWGIVIRNATGTAFHATGTNNECQFIGIKADNA